jgi:hypothetical protein
MKTLCLASLLTIVIAQPASPVLVSPPKTGVVSPPKAGQLQAEQYTTITVAIIHTTTAEDIPKSLPRPLLSPPGLALWSFVLLLKERRI